MNVQKHQSFFYEKEFTQFTEFLKIKLGGTFTAKKYDGYFINIFVKVHDRTDFIKKGGKLIYPIGITFSGDFIKKGGGEVENNRIIFGWSPTLQEPFLNVFELYFGEIATEEVRRHLVANYNYDFRLILGGCDV